MQLLLAALPLFLLVQSAAAQPGGGGRTCGIDLKLLCWQSEGQPRGCYDCAHEHARALQAAKCQRHEIQEFCGGGSHACESALRTDCPNHGGAHTSHTCGRCVEEHANSLEGVCSREEVEAYCEVPENPRCREAMVHECGRLEGRELICEHCLEAEHTILLRAGCEKEDLFHFCSYRRGQTNKLPVTEGH